jgi:hypothetical protein
VYGYNRDVDTTTDPESLWNGGGIYTGFNATAAQTLQVFSASANDTANGTGARTVRLEGLDGNYNEITETVTLNGTTPVLTTFSFLRLQRQEVISVGSAGHNVGEITVRQSVTTANVFSVMPAEQNRSHLGCYTVPAGYNGFMWNAFFSLIREGGQPNYDREAKVDFYIRDFGEGKPFVSKEPIGITTGSFNHPCANLPFFIAEKSDIDMRIVSVSHDNSAIAGGFDIILVKKIQTI